MIFLSKHKLSRNRLDVLDDILSIVIETVLVKNNIKIVV